MRALEDSGITQEEETKNALEKAMKPKKQMDSYEPVFTGNTEFFSTYNPDMIEEALEAYLRQNSQPEPQSH